MTDLDLLHFEQLKLEVQAEYLKNHHPSSDDISKWKGIDIIYFQEDLRKKAKGNISEKSFYTYFKSNPTTKLPRIDMLNLLAIYADYQSWYDFKKKHLFANEVISDTENPTIVTVANEDEPEIPNENIKTVDKENGFKQETEKRILQNSTTEFQSITETQAISTTEKTNFILYFYNRFKEYVWLAISATLLTMVLILIFWQRIFATEYTFTFIDADRNTPIKDNLEIKILKDKETPIQFDLNSSVFKYRTQSKTLRLEVTSPFYKQDTIFRNLDPAHTKEIIELEPDVYAQALFYYSTTDVSKKSEEIEKKRKELNKIISNNALIYQVIDNETYGIETLDKEKYIGFVTTPTTSLKNFKMIRTKTLNGKIVLIKFKIQQDENK